jgi:hypothetical protein
MGRHPLPAASSSADWAASGWAKMTNPSPKAQLPMNKCREINMTNTSIMGDYLKTGGIPVLVGSFYRGFFIGTFGKV